MRERSRRLVLKLQVLALLAVVGVSACQRAEITEATTPPAANVAANTAVKAAPHTIDRPVSEPYTGELSIFENPDRAEKLQIDRVMDILKISEGKSVADIGAGSGWFSTRAAKRIGAAATVYAVEINQEYINYINERAKREDLPNIRTVLGTESDPRLPPASIDACLMLKTYHEIAQPVMVLENLRTALRPGALLGIIDRNGKGDDHGLAKQRVITEAKRAGFTLKDDYDFTKADGMDYFLVFGVAR